jgi:hypothetical protein
MDTRGLVLTDKVHAGSGYAQYRDTMVHSTMGNAMVLFLLWLASLICLVASVHVYDTSDFVIQPEKVSVVIVLLFTGLLFMSVGLGIAFCQCDKTQVITAAPVAVHRSVIISRFESMKHTPWILAVFTLIFMTIVIVIMSDVRNNPLLVVATVIVVALIAAAVCSVLIILGHSLFDVHRGDEERPPPEPQIDSV